MITLEGVAESKNPTLLDALVCWRDAQGTAMTNVPWLVSHHSPTGFEFGYNGSGPADLALNVCEWFLRCVFNYSGEQVSMHEGVAFALSLKLHQRLKEEIISHIPQESGGVVPFWLLKEWFDKNLALFQAKAHLFEDDI